MYPLPDSLALIFKELANNKLRTFLSLLGITIGIFCVISVLTVFDSLQQNIQNNMKSLGSNVLYIGKYPWIPEDKGEYPWWKYRSRPVCNYNEVIQLKKNLRNALRVCICYMENGKVHFKDKQHNNAGIYAVSNDFDKMQAFDIAQGRYFTAGEMQNSGFAGVVIGNTIAKELFGPNQSPAGNEIKLLNHKLKVIGVMKKQGRTITGFDFDGGIILPYLFFATIKNIDNNIGNGFADPMLMVESKKNADLSDMMFEIKSTLRAIRKIKPREPDNFSINKLDAIQDSIKSIFSQIKVFGWIIGLFSLIVGSFGIANIMYVTVKERTNQIGIKKALGAKTRNILLDFLTESVILCLIGGIGGIILVFFLSIILSIPLGFPVFLSANNFILGIFISLIVGIIAGYLPARKAAHMNPVTAIRS